jgi:hypothetical protein
MADRYLQETFRAIHLLEAIRSPFLMKRQLQPSMHPSDSVLLLIKTPLEIKWLSQSVHAQMLKLGLSKRNPL